MSMGEVREINIVTRLDKIQLRALAQLCVCVYIGIVGAGIYVGLPLAKAFCEQQIQVIGFDIDQNKIDLIAKNQSYIKHIASQSIANMRENNLFEASSDFSGIADVDVIIICVPTPLSKHRGGGLRF